jgi:hypothetical protein
MTMTPQNPPLYVTTGNGQIYLVIGWNGNPTAPEFVPVLAPVTHPGPVKALALGAVATYSLTRPGPPAGPVSVPAPDETVTLPKIQPGYQVQSRQRDYP